MRRSQPGWCSLTMTSNDPTFVPAPDGLPDDVTPFSDADGYLWMHNEWSHLAESGPAQRTKLVMTVAQEHITDSSVSLYRGPHDELPTTAEIVRKSGINPSAVDYHRHTVSQNNLPESHPADDAEFVHLHR